MKMVLGSTILVHRSREKAGFEATLGHDSIQNKIPETETRMEFIVIFGEKLSQMDKHACIMLS